jgi:hypothetical protein
VIKGLGRLSWCSLYHFKLCNVAHWRKAAARPA